MTNGYTPYPPGYAGTDQRNDPGRVGYGIGSAQARAQQVRAQGQQAQYGYANANPRAGAYAQQPYAAQTYGQVPYGDATVEGQMRAGAPYASVQASQASQAPKRKRGAAFWLAIIVMLLCIALAAILVFTTLMPQPKSSRMGMPGQLEGKTPEEVQAELNRVVEEGMFNISIASAVLFADGTSPGELRIENVPGNLYLMKVVIRLDSTGEKVYETDMIEPNNHIQQDTLDVDLDAGTYDATAVFTAYDPETEAEMGQAAAKITLLVQS